jgi:alginate O-acetyltransferase complex protein AlgI
MVFSSAVFLFLFLPSVILLHTVLRVRWLQNLWLLLASLFFYAWGEPAYVVLMIVSIVFNYIGGRIVERLRDHRAVSGVLAVVIFFNLGLLFFYKYANFVVENLDLVLGMMGWSPVRFTPVPLPVGISFFTFQALSYVVDVYRGDAAVQRNPLRFGLYISLFPQLIAGPIVRYKDVDLQLNGRVVKRSLFASGVRRFVVGLSKKMILANTFAVVADRVFDLDVSQLTTGVAWTGALAYAMQIYFDFSGYSDMAIGIGRMLGFRFLENFHYPYIAISIRDFWRRWHISLSNWFRDYLYIPLGGNRKGSVRVGFNLVLVFVLCGIWHGASWSFLVWGLYHGLFLFAERLRWGRLLDRAPRGIRHLYTLLVVLGGWIFFRAETLPGALSFFRAMCGLADGDGIVLNYRMLWTPEFCLMIVAGLLAATPLVPVINRRLAVWARESVRQRVFTVESVAWCLDVVVIPFMLIFCAVMLASGTHNPFIYFRF